jgi:hypothetical protein
MGKSYRWADVAGQFVTELYARDGELYDAYSDKNLDVQIEAALEHGESYELTIEFRSSGYYDPGVLSGPPEKCYPPEGDDDREMEGVALSAENNKEVELTHAEQEEMFEIYRGGIEDVELETQDDDGGRY